MNGAATLDVQCPGISSASAAVSFSSIADGAVTCDRSDLQANNSKDESGNPLLESRSMKIQNNLFKKVSSLDIFTSE